MTLLSDEDSAGTSVPPVRSAVFITLCFLLAALLAQVFCVPAYGRQQTQARKIEEDRAREGKTTGKTRDLSKSHVLLLHAYTYETASSVVMDPIFLKGFTDAGLGAFNLHFEFMDLVKHPEPAHRREVVEYLRRKFVDQPIDVIIAVHQTSLDFLMEQGKDLFPGVPVVNVIAAPAFVRDEDFRATQTRLMLRLKRSFVIMPFALGIDATVKCILDLQPDTSTLAVISGSDRLDRIMEGTARSTLGALRGKFKVEYLSSLPLNEVLERVAVLPPKTAILYTIFSADGQRTYRNPDVARQVSEAANVPLFGLYDTLLGNGIVGGVMPHHGHEAERSVNAALGILRGNLPVESVTISPAPLKPVFDWAQLKRWRFDERRLPSGSLVINRPRTLWSEHKWFVVGAAVVAIDAGRLERYLGNSAGPAKERLDDIKNQIVNLAQDVHSLARQLHPSILDDLGLVRAIESECAAFLAREGIPVAFIKENVPATIAKDVSLAIYRIVQEGLRNISKHACANNVSVSLQGAGRGLVLSVKDDGIGFDPSEAGATPGIGLSSLRERTRLINGHLAIESRPGQGTIITVEAPLDTKG